jgi:hypothetical protein
MPQKIQSSTALQLRSVAIWALLQLALLGIGAAGFPLWAHHPLPHESLALPEVLCGQIFIIAMLFPLLGNSILSIAINLVMMLPFDAFAGLLSSTPRLATLRGFGAVGLWLLGLTGWRRFLGESRFNHFGVTIAVVFSAGGAIWDYVRWETALTDGRRSFSALTILPEICRLLGENTWLAWLECATPLLLLLPVAILSTLLHRGPKSPSTSLHQIR